jgi:hypothetical protein
MNQICVVPEFLTLEIILYFHDLLINKVNKFRNRPWRPVGLWDFKRSTISRQSAHRWRQCCQPYAPAALYSPEKYCYPSDTHFFYRLSKHQSLVRLERLGKLIRIIHLVGFRTRDLPACNIALTNAVPLSYNV